MGMNHSLFTFFSDASIVVQAVMLLLLAASVLSWTYIIQRSAFFRQLSRTCLDFQTNFWNGSDLSKFYSRLHAQKTNKAGMESIFQAGFKEFAHLKQLSLAPDVVMQGVQRVMNVAQAREVERLEDHLSVLATIGAISPFVGLFGTVWGIMTSFQALGQVQQATISMVAPGISEALIATAMGLFTAIPAVIAYNRYSHKVDKFANQYDLFQEEFAAILYRELHTGH